MLRRSLSIYCLILLTGCLGAKDEQFDAHTAALTALDEGVAQCLEGQASLADTAARQAEQLAQQSQQLAAIDDHLRTRSVPEAIAQSGEAPVCVAVEGAPSVGKLMIGELEQVWLPDLGLSLPGRVDTGAETASLDARNVELFERNSRRWVRFEILHPDSGEAIELERRVSRRVIVYQSNSTEPERRPVIKMRIQLGPVSQTAEFTLTNRSHLDYQILIGRNILRDVMVVDVSEQNLVPSDYPDTTDTAADEAQDDAQ